MTTQKYPRAGGPHPAAVPPIPKSQKPPGELLSSEEKRANHIASEQKRRQAIREGFDKLTEVVPGLSKNQGRSEAVVLDKTIYHLKDLIEERRTLIRQCKSQGLKVPEELEKY